MNPRELLRRSRLARGAYWRARRLLWAARRARAVARYLDAHSQAKLHLGAGANILPGWLNVDYSPFNGEVVFADATRMPFTARSFSHVFSEHLIEHLTLEQGRRMLAEAHRVLRAGGLIRLTTPDLDFFAGLARGLIEPGVSADYLAGWARDNGCAPERAGVARAINNIFYGYGHRFIFDFQTLRELMKTAGFAEVRRLACGQTGIAEFANIECQAARYTRHETFAVEALKP